VRLSEIIINDVPPVTQFEVSDLSDVVVLAGRNGIGKTRLVQALVDFFKTPQKNNMHLVIEATADTERQSWGCDILDTSKPLEVRKLITTLQKSRHRSNWSSSVVQFESDRSIVQIKYLLLSSCVTV
jgi:translation initiation factor RLI1